MASRSFASVNQGSAFYVNIVAVTAADSLDSTGAAANVAACSGAAGTVLVRDMGRTVRIASQGATSHVASAPINLVLRKVQIVSGASVMGAANVPLSNFVGLNDGVNGADYGVFYVRLCPGDAKWARISL